MNNKLKIYLASSWKNKDNVNELATLLREDGYEVDDFTDESQGRFVFSLTEITEDELKLDALKMMDDHRAQRAFKEDKERIDWCDVIICILPCGLSAHMELGYAKGSGKKVILYAPGCFEPGKWEVMYGFADIMTEDLLGVEDYLAYLAEMEVN
ncbi:hypothetical protein [Methanobacterium sp.]|uniref:hypothetical protein n=1 Tax=Methanobacterium sp. TaxID=2164 RepID=UPI0031587944